MQGADTVIYERLASNNPVNNSMKGVTREHMEQYGAAGLRTLCLAYCELDKADYDAYVSVTAPPPEALKWPGNCWIVCLLHAKQDLMRMSV